MTLFVNIAQAAALLGTDEDGVRALLDAGELHMTRDGIASEEIALLLLDREREAKEAAGKD